MGFHVDIHHHQVNATLHITTLALIIIHTTILSMALVHNLTRLIRRQRIHLALTTTHLRVAIFQIFNIVVGIRRIRLIGVMSAIIWNQPKMPVTIQHIQPPFPGKSENILSRDALRFLESDKIS